VTQRLGIDTAMDQQTCWREVDGLDVHCTDQRR
jgi:hypothetical protein